MISDLGLPDGSGLDLMRTLHARGRHVPGIALSGFGQEQDMHASHEAGFAVHLVKPVAVPKLEEAIVRVAGQGGSASADAGSKPQRSKGPLTLDDIRKQEAPFKRL